MWPRAWVLAAREPEHPIQIMARAFGLKRDT
jgi:hypothetical protein